MTVKDLKEYIGRWPESEEIRPLAMAPKKRIVWLNDHINLIVAEDSEVPVIGMDLREGEPMDEEMIQAVEEDEAAAGWIPIEERLPERNKSVLICMKSRTLRNGICIQTGSYDNGFWFVQGAAGYESLATFEFHVIAWMPLPKPYREGEK